jgi:hypothetical protein
MLEETHPLRLSRMRVERLVELLIRVIEPVARLIDAISRIR